MKLRSETKFDWRYSDGAYTCHVAAAIIGAAVVSSALAPDAPTIPGADPGVGQAANANAAVSKESLDFNKRVYEEGKPRQAAIDALGNRVVESQLKSQDQASALADDYANYMKGTFRPVEGAIVGEAMKNDVSQQEQAASEAGAGVDTQFEAGRANTARTMAAMGINPNSGRWGSINQGSVDQQAATKADAMNKARIATRGLNWSKRLDAASLGRNLPSSQATSAGLALTAGNSAVNNANAGAVNARADAGVVNQGFGTAVSANNSAGNLYLGNYDAQIKGYNAQQAYNASQSQGMGQLAGAALSAYGKYGSSKKIKTNKEDISDAEIVDEVKKLPVQKWDYKEGEGDGGTHIGPYAEDVKASFGDVAAPGGKAIDVISMMGINLAATKELAKQVESISSKMAKRGVNHGL